MRLRDLSKKHSGLFALFIALLLCLGIVFYYLKSRSTKVLETQILNPHSDPLMDEIIRAEDEQTAIAEKSAESVQSAITYDVNPEIHKAIYYLNNAQWKEAEPLLLTANREEPENQKVLSSLVTLYETGLQDNAKAQSYMEKIISLDPESVVAFERYRFLSRDAGQEKRAIDFILKEGDPTLYQTPLTVAQLYRDQKNYDKALVYFQKAAQLESTQRGIIYEQIADCYAALLKKDLAVAALETAFKEYAENNQKMATENVMRVQDTINASIKYMDWTLERRDFEKAALMLSDLLAKDPANPKLLAYQKQIDSQTGR